MGAVGAGIIFAVLSVEATGGWETFLLWAAVIIAIIGILVEFS